MEPEAELTAQEAAVYDRQMRLWGVEAQRRLQNSHVLISGLTQLGSELAKNLVLSGMNVTLHDHEIVTQAHVESQFLLRQEHIGHNRAQACLAAVCELNPLVKVAAEIKPLGELLCEYFDKFSVICVMSASRKLQLHLDAICREKSIAFYAGHSFGLTGIFFADLNKHTYRRNTPVGTTDNAPAEAPPAITIEFPSLEASQHVRWADLKSARKRGPGIPRPYVAYQLLLDYYDIHNKFPTTASASEFTSLATSKLVKQGLPADFFTAQELSTLASVAQADIVPVCAITAGILGQEVIKAISLKDEPLCNYFYFDGSAGTIRRIG
ncbi:SUMO-activating enzyme (SAE) [Thraustotheca clavata]|uniref:SUMO-activating enzyme (SAE) n=1 Tax=Thraustotheca clavata TaxID=74557 RepID=A0A1V9ZWX8_9STRA|nr:SUMO-activating enzyme (SAE) [Thraustotheca clavata]